MNEYASATPRAPWWTYAIGANLFLVVFWLLLAGYRAGQGRWLVAALEAYIAYSLSGAYSASSRVVSKQR